MKTCSKCGVGKNLTDFNYRNVSKGIFSPWCKKCMSIYAKNPHNKERKKIYWKKYYSITEKKDKHLARGKTVKGRDSHRKAANKWAKTLGGRAYYNEKVARRRLSKINSTPKWLTPDMLNDIKTIYKKAHLISIETGVPHEVDHIYPIRGKGFTGLHVPWNLQILPMLDNRIKSNNTPKGVV